MAKAKQKQVASLKQFFVFNAFATRFPDAFSADAENRGSKIAALLVVGWDMAPVVFVDAVQSYVIYEMMFIWGINCLLGYEC